MDRNKLWTRDFAAMCLCSFFIFLTFYLLASALPLFVKDSLRGSQQQMGLTITFWSIGAVSLRLFAGSITDRYGRKKVSVLALLLFVLASFTYFGAASSLALLLVLRIFHGASYGVAATATSALASELIPESRKGEGIGYFSMFMSVAMVVGPAFGLFLWNRFEDTGLFVATAAVSLLALACVAVVRSKTGKADADAHGSSVASPMPQPPSTPEKFGWGRLFERKAAAISLAGMVLAFSYSSLTSFIPSYAIEIHQEQAASWFFIVFAAMIIASRPVVGRVFDRYGAQFLVYPGILCFVLGMVLLSQSHSASLLLISGAIIGIGYGALVPAFQTVALLSVSRERQGSATSTFFLLFDLGYGIGSFVLGLVAGRSGYPFMYFAAGLLALVSALIYFMSSSRLRRFVVQ